MLHLYLKFQKARKCNGIFGKEKTKGGIWYHLKLWPTKKQHIFALGLIWGTFTCLPSRYLSSRLMSTLILNSNQQSDRRESHFSYLSIHFCSIASIPEWIGASYFTPGEVTGNKLGEEHQYIMQKAMHRKRWQHGQMVAILSNFDGWRQFALWHWLKKQKGRETIEK